MDQTQLISGIIVGISNLVLFAFGGFKVYVHIAKKLDRIEYALFNDGNGAIQKINELHRNQGEIKTDMAVVKSRMEVA